MTRSIHEIAAPHPGGTIQALGSLGYSLAAAVADIVDNSIDAGARNVKVSFEWAGRDSFIEIADDGTGMSEAELVTAMTISARGPQVERAADELGRFGMGLKTASFSQARELVVCTRRRGALPATRCWDLDEVVRQDRWELIGPSAEAAGVIEKSIRSRRHGTIVLWRHLTKLVDPNSEVHDAASHEQFLSAIESVECHLGMVFARFINKKSLVITINEQKIEGWDPFLQTHPFTQPQPIEYLQVGSQTIQVQAFILPQRRHLSDEAHRAGGGPNGWLDQEGFYVYRNDRLIVSGDWLGLDRFRKDEKHVLARIAVNLPSAFDRDWSVDVMKASAQPPLPLRTPLTRIAKDCRAKAYRVLTHIARTVAITRSDDLSYVWRPIESEGKRGVQLNWRHPLVIEALRLAEDGRPVVRALLRFIEETVPVAALRVMFDTENEADRVPFAETPGNEVLEVAERIYGAYISQGLTPRQAAERLRATAPFNEYPDILELMNIPATPDDAPRGDAG
jgi:hypothetical protein